MNISCYIIDDEPHAIRVLADFIKKTPGLELLGQATDPLVALTDLPAMRPSVVFADIDMPAVNGLALAGMINSFSRIVFTTAYPEYAVSAFEKEAVDYLLKPIPYERFLACIQRLRKADALTAADTPAELYINSGDRGKAIRVIVNDIQYLEAASNYVEIHLKDGQEIAYLSLAAALERLPQNQFSRIHKSFAVNHRYITAVEYFQVKLTTKVILPIGRVYRESFRRKIENLLMDRNK